MDKTYNVNPNNLMPHVLTYIAGSQLNGHFSSGEKWPPPNQNVQITMLIWMLNGGRWGVQIDRMQQVLLQDEII